MADAQQQVGPPGYNQQQLGAVADQTNLQLSGPNADGAQTQPGLYPGYIPQQLVPNPGFTQQQLGPHTSYIQQQPVPNLAYIQQHVPNLPYIQQQPVPNGYIAQQPGYTQWQLGPNLGYTHQQPPPNPGMSANSGNRNVKNLPVGPDGREWSNGLYDVEFGTCLLAWFFPCILYGRVKQRYNHLNMHGTPDPEQGGLINSGCIVHGLINVCCGCGCQILQMETRKHIRERYNIKGESSDDCLTSFFCVPCDLTQESQELELEERSFVKQDASRNYPITLPPAPEIHG